MNIYKTFLLSIWLLSPLFMFKLEKDGSLITICVEENHNQNIISSDSMIDFSLDIMRETLKTVNETQRIELFSIKETTLYDVYSDEELELLFRVVEAEATDSNVMCKSHVASVIFNRLEEGWWSSDLTKNIMAKRQFEVITNGRYKRVNVTEETILACEIAFRNDTAQGALFFDSTKGKSWAHENCEYIFKDDVHWFYR